MDPPTPSASGKRRDARPCGPDTVHIPAGRLKALTRAFLWGVASALCSAVAFAVYSGLDFAPSALSNRLVEYAIAAVMAPVPITAVVAAVKMLRWLLLGVWPARLGVFARVDGLVLRLGPFGTRNYDVTRLSVEYPFELSNEDGAFESFLPEDEQRRTLLPWIRHPNAPAPINQTILRFVSLDEPEAAGRLRPMIDAWRTAARPIEGKESLE